MSYFIPYNLPMDLPQNWKDTDYVSPNGTEVNLTKQHGYNYLMQQVNNSQAGVIALGKALCSDNNNLIDNSFFMNPVNRKNGYIAPKGIKYYGDDDFGTLQGETSQNYQANVYDGIGYITVNGSQYSVKPEQLIPGYIHDSTGSFGFDRWWGNRVMATCPSDHSGILIQASATNQIAFFRQPIVDCGLIAGRRVVFSIYVSSLQGSSTFSIHKGNSISTTRSSQNTIASKTISAGMNYVVADIPEDVGNTANPYLFCSIEFNGVAKVQIVAVKLQPGFVSTLAYQDDDNNWHITDVPNKIVETVRCNGAPVEIGGQGMIVTPADIGLSAANVLAKAKVIEEVPENE